MLMIRDFSTMFQQMSGMPIGSKDGKNMLKAAGIDTNGARYKAAIKHMSERIRGGVAYTNPQAIKNIMANYDENGDFKDPVTGMTGLVVNGIPQSERHKIIHVSEDARQDMFETTKREFIRDNGDRDAERTQRSEVYQRYQHSVSKEDRLKGTWTLGQYEKAYRRAFVVACKQMDPAWDIGKDIPSGALDGITRESIDSSLVRRQDAYGETLVRKTVDISV